MLISLSVVSVAAVGVPDILSPPGPALAAPRPLALALSPKNIPETEKIPEQPPELVAVLGQQRLRHGCSVFSLAYSPDGKLLASAGMGPVARVWDEATGRPVAELCGHHKLISAVTFLDKQTLASSSGGDILLWKLSGARREKPVLALQDKRWQALGDVEGRVDGLAFAPKNKLLAVTLPNHVLLWDLSGAKPVLKELLPAPLRRPSLAFSRDETKLAAAGLFSHRIWELQPKARPRLLRDVAPSNLSMFAFAMSPDGKRLAVDFPSPDNTVRILDLAGRRVDGKGGELKLPGGQLLVLAFAPDGKTLAVGEREGSVSLWDVSKNGPRCLKTLSGHYGPVRALAFRPDGKVLASGSPDGTIRQWVVNGAASKERNAPTGHAEALNAVAFSPDGASLATGGDDSTIRLWNLTGAAPVERAVLRDHKAPVTALLFHPDGRLISAGGKPGRDAGPSKEKSIRIWSLKDPAPRVQRQLENTKPVRGLALSPDRKLLAASLFTSSRSFGDRASLWDLSAATPARKARLSGRPGSNPRRCGNIAFSPDGKWLLSGGAGDDSGVFLWDLTNLQAVPSQPALRLREHKGGVSCIAFAPGGKRLVSGGVEYDARGPFFTIRFYESDGTGGWKTGKVLKDHTAEVESVAFSPDGKLLASGGRDGRLILWDPATGKKLRDWQLPSGVNAAAFAPDGRHLATANANSTAYVFRVGDIFRKAAPPPGK
jgi:WD40 repeat protein